MIEKKRVLEFDSLTLHLMGMVFMLLDHMWATVLSYDWMTCIGRLTYPIFAFLIVEGYFHTSNFRRYMLRLLILAIISEIPFNIMYGGALIYPVHQNVIWTFLIALLGISIMEKVRKKKNTLLYILVCILAIIIGFILGYATFSDYYGCGVLTVYVFYFFYRGRTDNFVEKIFKSISSRNKKLIWMLFCFVGQFVCLYYMNVELLGGYYYDIDFMGVKIELIRQGLALFSLIPIWLYRGKLGYNNKFTRIFNYLFYPVHCLILGLIAMFS